MKIVKKISENLEIRELDLSEFDLAYPVLQQLRPRLSLSDFLEKAAEMVKFGYRVEVICQDNEILAYAGFAEQVNLYEGHHYFVYELVADENHRGQGLGRLLLNHLKDEAKARGLDGIVLTSGIQRSDAHRFYEEKIGLNKTSYVFRKLFNE